MYVLNPADNSLQTFGGLCLLSDCLQCLFLFLGNSILLFAVQVEIAANSVHVLGTLYHSIFCCPHNLTRCFTLTSALFAFLALRFFSVISCIVVHRFQDETEVMHVNIFEHFVCKLAIDRRILRHINRFRIWLTDRNNDISILDLLRRFSRMCRHSL